ncbi:MAG: hypothetical protein KY468_20960 [Armatimonadetes bacterium]|nr:hypothetical protein [Armatimonadota bacterium]
MTAVPRAYPLLARLRYAYYEAGEALRVVENAWWEGRWDGGRALGAVVEAMDHPRTPHRLRVHLRLSPEDAPVEMMLSLLRPDGEGEATYHFEAERVVAEGVWDGEAFSSVVPMPPGYTVAPYCIAADGLHFRSRRGAPPVERQPCYMVNPKQPQAPLAGASVSFSAEPLGEETLMVDGHLHTVQRYRAAYAEEPAPPADYWVTEEGYPLRMVSHRRTGEPVEVACIRFQR